MQREKWLYSIKVCFVCRWIQHLLHYNAVKAFLFLIVGDTNIKQSFNVIVNNITFPLTHLKSINPRIYPYQRDRYMAYFLEVSSVSGIDWANIRWKNYYHLETIVSPTNFGDIQSIYRNFNKPIYTKTIWNSLSLQNSIICLNERLAFIIPFVWKM